jgi:hypothetical protein
MRPFVPPIDEILEIAGIGKVPVVGYLLAILKVTWDNQ